MPQTVPQVSGGLPLVGHSLEFFKDPIALLRRGFKEQGDIYSVKVGGRNFVALANPKLTEFYFKETDKLLDIRQSQPYFKRMFSPDFYVFAPFDNYMQQRSVVMPRFKGDALRGYVEIITYEVDKLIKKMGDSGEWPDLVHVLGPLVMDIAAHSFMGKDFSGKLGNQFFDLFRDFSGGMELVLPHWLPIPRLLKAKKARKEIHDMLQSWMNSRRAHPVEPPDFFQTIVAGKYPDGTPVPDEIIRHMILLLVWAGHETTAGHISWAFTDLLTHPEYLNECRQEIDTLFGGNSGKDMTWEHARALTKLELGLKETERMHPVAYMQMRVAGENFELEGKSINKGDFVIITPCVMHRRADLYPDPNTYKPHRFQPGSGESGPESTSLVGFGGGFHRCAGVNFARLEMRIALAMLLKRYDFQLLDPVRPRGGSSTYWPDVCRVRYSLRKDAPQFSTTDLPPVSVDVGLDKANDPFFSDRV